MKTINKIVKLVENILDILTFKKSFSTSTPKSSKFELLLLEVK